MESCLTISKQFICSIMGVKRVIINEGDGQTFPKQGDTLTMVRIKAVAYRCCVEGALHLTAPLEVATMLAPCRANNLLHIAPIPSHLSLPRFFLLLIISLTLVTCSTMLEP